MKYKYLIAAFIFGMLVVITGATFKIMHWGFGENSFINGNSILATGLLIEAVVSAITIIKLITSNNKTLNK